MYPSIRKFAFAMKTILLLERARLHYSSSRRRRKKSVQMRDIILPVWTFYPLVFVPLLLWLCHSLAFHGWKSICSLNASHVISPWEDDKTCLQVHRVRVMGPIYARRCQWLFSRTGCILSADAFPTDSRINCIIDFLRPRVSNSWPINLNCEGRREH